ncbi:enoyl-CoA hydratase/isomerase family protein [Marinibaculum pumilum]|uniref:Enoyl-CoA hydratase/isomerase family protein n=1 Tax=Marinibaculum pumilum TaxID=1766165 RepID=A0ABV7L480_9PROT
MTEPVLLSEDRDGVRHLVMNRPEKLNALNFALTEALVAAFEAAEADGAVRAMILTGAGRGFCAGADTSEFKDLTPDNRDLVERRAALTGRLHAVVPQLRMPVVALVNGHAMGGGAGLALACDYVMAADSAIFAYPEVRHGIVAAIVMASLVRQVGRKIAFDLVATGRRIDAAEAQALGLVNRVVPAAALADEGAALAASLAAQSPQAMAESKKLLQAVADLPLQEGLELGRQTNARMRGFRKDDAS